MIFFFLLISIMPLTQHPFWTRYAGQMTMIKYVGGACCLYAIVYLLSRPATPKYFQTWQSRWFVILLSLVCISEWTSDASVSIAENPLTSYVCFFLLFFITLTIVDSLSRLRCVLLAIIGSIAWASIYVVREYQKYHAMYSGFRPGWVVGDANYFSISALVSLPLAFYLSVESSRKWERIVCLACLCVTLLAVTLAASRGGFLGLAAAFLFVAVRSPHWLRNLSLAVLLLVPLSLISPSSPLDRLLKPTSSDREAAEARTVSWMAGLRMVRMSPLTGVGPGNFKPLMLRFADPKPGQTIEPHIAHNAYIEIAAESGVPALVAFLALLWCSFWILEQVNRATHRAGPVLLRQAALGIQGGLVGNLVALFFVSGEYQKLFWLMVFLSIVVHTCAEHYGHRGVISERREDKRFETRQRTAPQLNG